MILKIVHKFPSNLAGIAAAITAEHYVLKLCRPTSPNVYTHTTL